MTVNIEINVTYSRDRFIFNTGTDIRHIIKCEVFLCLKRSVYREFSLVFEAVYTKENTVSDSAGESLAAIMSINFLFSNPF